METDKGENFEVESGPYAGLGDRSPIWLLIGVLMIGGMAFGGYVYHVDSPSYDQPRLTLPASADSSPDGNTVKRNDQQALPGGEAPANLYGASGNTSAGGSGSGQPAPSTY